MRMIRLAVLGVALTFTAARAYAIDKTVTTRTAKAKKVKGVVGATTGGTVAGTSALTSQECKGMGGTVNSPAADMNCKAGEDACYTTDKHGVIRAACIDEVAAD